MDSRGEKEESAAKFGRNDIGTVKSTRMVNGPRHAMWMKPENNRHLTGMRSAIWNTVARKMLERRRKDSTACAARRDHRRETFDY